jgi:hypothetical protein
MTTQLKFKFDELTTDTQSQLIKGWLNDEPVRSEDMGNLFPIEMETASKIKSLVNSFLAELDGIGLKYRDRLFDIILNSMFAQAEHGHHYLSVLFFNHLSAGALFIGDISEFKRVAAYFGAVETVARLYKSIPILDPKALIVGWEIYTGYIAVDCRWEEERILVIPDTELVAGFVKKLSEINEIIYKLRENCYNEVIKELQKFEYRMDGVQIVA